MVTFVDLTLDAAERRQQERDARERMRVNDLENLKNGKIQAVEILSDEEPTVKSPGNSTRNKVAVNFTRRDTPKKPGTGLGSQEIQHPASNVKPRRTDTERLGSSITNPIPAPPDVRSSFPCTPQHVQTKIPQTSASVRKTDIEQTAGPIQISTANSRISAITDSEAIDRTKDSSAVATPTTTQAASQPTVFEPTRGGSSTQSNGRMKPLGDGLDAGLKSNTTTLGISGAKSPKCSPAPKISSKRKDGDNAVPKSNTTALGISGVRSPKRSPAVKTSLNKQKGISPVANERIDDRAPKKYTLDPFNFPAAPKEIERNRLPTPALTPASLADNLADAEQLVEEPEVINLHVDDIQRVLERHIHFLHEYQEDLVERCMKNAEELHQSFPGPKKEAEGVSLLKRLFHQRNIDGKSPTKQKQYSLVVRASAYPARAGSKPNTVTLQACSFSSTAQEVPKVKSIGRLGVARDLLARNVRNLTHMPWFEDNEADPNPEQDTSRYADIRNEYDISIKKLSNQRRCRAVGNMWRPQVLNLFSELGVETEDVVYYLLHKDESEAPAAGTLSPKMHDVWNERTESCENCKIEDNDDCRGPEGRRIVSLIERPPTERRLAMAGLLCAVFIKVTTFNLWHIVSECRYTQELQQQYLEMQSKVEMQNKMETEGKMDHQPTDILVTFCYACCEFKCVTHGAYVDTDDLNHQESLKTPPGSPKDEENPPSSGSKSRSEAVLQQEVVLDDPELGMNTRVYAALPIREKPARDHKCGVFCVGGPIADMLGLHNNNIVSGAARSEMEDLDPPTFNDFELCVSQVCFWNTAHRNQTRFEELSEDPHNGRSVLGNNEALFRDLLSMQLTSKRGPCELALAFPSVTCLEVFYLMICFMRTSPHTEVIRPADTASIPGTNVDLSNDKTPELRNSFVPCSHTGPCLPGTCSCAREKVSCEPSCGCSGGCPRRFKGCTCRDQRRKVCFEDMRCECWASNRECYPELCAGCGVQEVLDSVNKGTLDLGGRCKNNRIQLGIPRRTIMGVSEVHGWGLYAGEAIAKSDFISEYKGELISVAEGNRRGSVYHTLGREYLFKLSKDQELDGSRVSNKARFINNSSLAKNINVLPRLLLCNGVSRIILYAARDIAAGEEMFYDYGYHKEKRANFKEKPDVAKRPMLNSKATSQSTASVVPTTAPSVRSEPELHFQTVALDELEDELEEDLEEEPVLPTSEPDSEFNDLEQPTESSSSESEIVPPSSPALGPSGLRRPASRGDSFTRQRPRTTDVFNLPTHSPNDLPRTKLRLKLSKRSQEEEPDADSDVPLNHRISSRKLEEMKGPPRKRVEDSARKRKINPNDKRLGGAIQRKAAETFKRRKAETEALLGHVGTKTPTGRKRRRETRMASSPTEEPSASQPSKRLKLTLSQPKQLAAMPSPTLLPELPLLAKQATDDDLEMEGAEQDSASMSESSYTASPIFKTVAPGVPVPTGSFSATIKLPVPSGSGSQPTESIQRGSPAKAQPAENATQKEQNEGKVIARACSWAPRKKA